MGLRQYRLAEEIRDLLAGCFLAGQMSDPRLDGVTITFVKLSADLQLASVYFRVYNDESIPDTKDGLKHCKGFLRRHLATHLSLRRVPELRFFYDESIEKGARIEELLSQAKD